MKNQQIKTDSQQRNNPQKSPLQSVNLEQLDQVCGGSVLSGNMFLSDVKFKGNARQKWQFNTKPQKL